MKCNCLQIFTYTCENDFYVHDYGHLFGLRTGKAVLFNNILFNNNSDFYFLQCFLARCYENNPDFCFLRFSCWGALKIKEQV